VSNLDFRKVGRWTLMFAVLGSLSLTAAIGVGRRSMRMSSAMAAAADPGAFSRLAPGAATQAVVEIISVDKGSADCNLLNREREDVYLRTTTPVEIQFSDTTPVVMGKLADLRTGVVVLVKGTVNASHGLDAQQIVVVTGYVQVR
jgi:hypothetical protein